MFRLKILMAVLAATGLAGASSAALLINPAAGQTGDIQGNGDLVANVGSLPTDNTWNRVGAVGSDAKAFTENRADVFSNQVGSVTLAINAEGTGIWNNTGVDIATLSVGDILELSLLVGLRNGNAPSDALYEVGVISGGVFTSLVDGTFEDTDFADGVLDQAPTISHVVTGTEVGLITVHIRQDPTQTSGRAYVDGVSLNAVPEPGSLALLGLGGLLMAKRRRRN